LIDCLSVHHLAIYLYPIRAWPVHGPTNQSTKYYPITQPNRIEAKAKRFTAAASVVSIRRERVRDLIWTPDGDVFAVRARARMRDD
jgi:hypothetical protein